MNKDQVNQAETLWQILQDQLDILLAVISRPVVQQQLLALFFVLLMAWLLPEVGRRWWQRRYPTSDEPAIVPPSRGRRWLRALYHLYTPLLVLIFLRIMIWLFEQQGRPYGLLENVTVLIWIWLFYRVGMMVIVAKYGEMIRPYQTWIVTPLFIFLLLMQALVILPGSNVLINTTINIGAIPLSLSSLFTSLIIFYLFIIGAWVLKQMMVQYLPSRLNADSGVIESIATLTRYVLFTLGLIFSLSVLGLDFTSLAIVAGGLSVGIGIGLQEIISNFVSGLILLFEQTLRPGDVVELDGRISRVEQIRMRATIVRTGTNEEVIIPNNNFTTEQVKNLTRSDRLVKILVPFGVGYKSNPHVVRQLAVETALHHPLVLPQPAPGLTFLGYGESSIDFNLVVSVNQPEMTITIRSDLYYLLWDVFDAHNIELPFPQRDLNLRDGWEKIALDLSAQRSVNESED